MKRSPKQDELFEAYKSGKYTEFVLAGGAGSSKTFGIIMQLNAICQLCNGIRIKAFRLSDRNIKENLIPSFQKVFEKMKINVPIIDKEVRYDNGSRIVLGWADLTKDKDADNAKGFEAAIVWFNEANQINKKYIDTVRTRMGRWNEIDKLDKKFTIRPAIFLDFNPTNNWVKKEYYDKWRDGTLPDHVYFQHSTPYDNPFLSEDYIHILENLPESEKQRYLLCNWEYNDDVNLLIPYEYIKDNLIEVYEKTSHSIKYLGVDVARYGDDQTVLSYITDDVFIDCNSYSHQDTVETAERVMFDITTNAIGFEHIGVDVIGLGAGVVDTCWSNLYKVYAYNSAESPESKLDFYTFKNKRAEAYWLLREDLRNGNLKILNTSKTKKTLEELTQIKYIIKEKVIYIESKDDIKKRLGASPDYADALAIANYMRHVQTTKPISVIATKEEKPKILTRSF